MFVEVKLNLRWKNPQTVNKRERVDLDRNELKWLFRSEGSQFIYIELLKVFCDFQYYKNTSLLSFLLYSVWKSSIITWLAWLQLWAIWKQIGGTSRRLWPLSEVHLNWKGNPHSFNEPFKVTPVCSVKNTEEEEINTGTTAWIFQIRSHWIGKINAAQMSCS